MSLVVTGLNHQTSPVEVREALHFPEQDIPRALLHLAKRLEGVGAVILSTCNRVEVYASHSAPADTLHRELRAFLSEFHDVPEERFRAMLYEYSGRETAGHLFRVASSLDSLVVGEAQVLGQVHDAYLAALAEQATDKVISALFQRAFSVAKSVRSQTGINEGRVSIGSVAVDLAVSIFMDLSDKTVMVIGSGKMGQLALKSLVSRGIQTVLLVNRNVEKVRDLAATLRGEAIPLDALLEHLPRADIVISSTAAPDYILGVPAVEAALRRRGNAPVFLIDIAVPRDIDPAVGKLDNAYLYDIDDLQQVADANMEQRRKAIGQAMELVDRSVEQFTRWMGGLAAEPTIVSMAQELHAIRERELDKTLAALSDLSDAQRAEVTYLTKRIVNAILQRPMAQLKQEVAQQDPHTVLHLVKRLFGLKEVT